MVGVGVDDWIAGGWSAIVVVVAVAVVAAVVVVVDVVVDVEERLVGGCGVDNPAGNAVAVAVADDIFVVVFVLGLELLISFFFLLVVVNDD